MASLIQNVARQAHLTFSKSFQEESFPEFFNKLKSLVKQVRETDVSANPELICRRQGRFSFTAKAPVEYMGICENDVFSMGVFVINRGSKIPLHDHPRMYGILKVIHGKLRVKCYTPVAVDTVEDVSQILKRKVSSHELSLMHPARPHEEVILGVDDDPCILDPVEKNWHEIASVDGPAAFLDILAPPYGNDNRDCHYYRRVAEASTSGSGESVLWMQEVSSPRDFWCSSIPYTGPKVVIA